MLTRARRLLSSLSAVIRKEAESMDVGQRREAAGEISRAHTQPGKERI